MQPLSFAPTDKELAASVRDLFVALRRAVDAAQKAGLRVEFDEDVIELLHEPAMTMRSSQITIVRVL